MPEYVDVEVAPRLLQPNKNADDAIHQKLGLQANTCWADEAFDCWIVILILERCLKMNDRLFEFSWQSKPIRQNKRIEQTIANVETIAAVATPRFSPRRPWSDCWTALNISSFIWLDLRNLERLTAVNDVHYTKMLLLFKVQQERQNKANGHTHQQRKDTHTQKK